jgi:hypothetical protein
LFPLPPLWTGFLSSLTMNTDIKFSNANITDKHSCKVLTQIEFYLVFFMFFLKMYSLMGF